MTIDLAEALTTSQYEKLRIASRVPVDLPVKIRLRKKGFDFSGWLWQAARVTDYSTTGMGIQSVKSAHPLEAGMGLDISVKFPDLDKQLALEAQIIWVKPMPRTPDHYQCGVLFTAFRRDGRERLIGALAEKFCSYIGNYDKDLVVELVDSKESFDAATRLLYDEYFRRGYCEAHVSRRHYSYFTLLPDSRTFVVKRKGQLLGTLSLVVDSPCGLPMESEFSEEVAKLRRPGRRLAEVGLLALDLSLIGHRSFSLSKFDKMASLFNLIKIMFDYARLKAGVTDLVICVHPKHQALYRYLTYEDIGPVKVYPGACKKPALPMHLDIQRSISGASLQSGKGSYFVTKRLPDDVLERKMTWTSEALHEFLVEKKPIWESMPASAKEYFRVSYPKLTPD